MHGITMIFFFIIPMTTGAFGNYLLPLMIGARDMAFPRLNALQLLDLPRARGSSSTRASSSAMAPNAGWFDYVPLANRDVRPRPQRSTSTASGSSSTASRRRSPRRSSSSRSSSRARPACRSTGCRSSASRSSPRRSGSCSRCPSLTADTIFLFLDRNVGTHFFDVAHGGSALLWQHLFWIFGHPEVYILIVPAFGIATEIIPAFTQRRVVAFPLVAIAELLVVFIGFGVWAHHMFATGMPTVTVVFFARRDRDGGDPVDDPGLRLVHGR